MFSFDALFELSQVIYSPFRKVPHQDGLSTRGLKRKINPVRFRFVEAERLEERFLLTGASNGSVASSMLIDGSSENVSGVNLGDLFGGAVSSIGDFNQDGIADLVVGAPQDDTGGTTRGAIYLVNLNADGTVLASTKIADSTNGGPSLRNGAGFGSSIAAIGDLDADGVTDLAVGAANDDVDGRERGAVYILFLNANGTVKSSTRIASGTNGGPKLELMNHFGTAVAAIGDINDDGVEDLAVGAPDGVNLDTAVGSVYTLLLNSNGSVRSSQRIKGEDFDLTVVHPNGFGSSIAALGDTNGDGITELAIGSPRTTFGPATGMVFLASLNSKGKATFKDTIFYNNFSPAYPETQFGISVASIGDIDFDGKNDLAIGALNGGPGSTTGAIYIVRSKLPNSYNQIITIGNELNGGPQLNVGDRFGISITAIGDLNGDGISELAIGSRDNNSNHASNGAVHILYPAVTDQRPTLVLNNGPVTYNAVSQPVPFMPNLVLNDSDTNPDLQIPGGNFVIRFDAASNRKQTKVFDTLDLSGVDSIGGRLVQQFRDNRYVIAIQFSHLATLNEIQDALRSITFSTTKAGLRKPTRTLEIQVQDQAGGFSNVVTQTINVVKS